MKPLAEARRDTPEGQSFVAFEVREPSFRFYWHFHAEWELTFIQSGSGTRFVGDSCEPFSPGDLVLLGGDLPHCWHSAPGRSSGPDAAIVVHFRVDSLPVGSPEFARIGRLLECAKRGCRFSLPVSTRLRPSLQRLLRLKGLRAWTLLLQVLSTLAEARATPLADEAFLKSAHFPATARLQKVIAFMLAHASDESLSLCDAAKVAGLSPAGFSRSFRRMTGEKWISRLQRIRIANACRLLVESDQTIAEVAFATGFGNLSNFNRRFRSLKRMTPSAYRGQFTRLPVDNR
ncbi:MAG: AraC family transcriptional regulator [Opitutaceae bacterium]|nr:AraC family transcriptional regulator [Opitutaceae bacterium]